MKKIFILFTMFILLCSCSSIDKKETKKENIQKEKVIEEEKYFDDNKLVIGLYSKTGNILNLVKSFTGTFVRGKDMLSFQSYASNEEQIKYKGNFKNTWLPIWQSYENYENYKIGYILDYSLVTGENIHHQILSPADTYDYFDYIQIYLYDALYHSSDSWYSHVTPAEYNDSTYLTSIKLTAGENIDKVEIPINLTVFTYDLNDFAQDGNYRGISKYTIEISKENNNSY